MDPSHYKDVTVSRGLKYHCYHTAPGTVLKPYLLFVHGFPCTSWYWHYQVKFFENEGYGVIVPDQLGYGGTSKPLDATAFKASLISKDIIDILDAEKVTKTIAIGHGWGSAVVSRLANYYPDRFIAFAFVAVGYLPPSYELSIAASHKHLGHSWFGYWLFFSFPDAKDIIPAHWDAFFSLTFPSDPKLWESVLDPLDIEGVKEYLLRDHKAPLPSYLTEEDKKTISQNLDYGKTIQSPLLWYSNPAQSIEYEDDKGIHSEHYHIQQPVFYAFPSKDYISLHTLYRAHTRKHCLNLTTRDFDADHWIPLAVPNEFNKELKVWIDGVDGSALSDSPAELGLRKNPFENVGKPSI